VNNVKLSIKLSCTKLKERFLEKEEKATVPNSDRIQRLIINAKS
jgi:hypothetical protein